MRFLRMMLRIQHERMHGHFIPSVREYFSLFGMHARTMYGARCTLHVS